MKRILAIRVSGPIMLGAAAVTLATTTARESGQPFSEVWFSVGLAVASFVAILAIEHLQKGARKHHRAQQSTIDEQAKILDSMLSLNRTLLDQLESRKRER